VAAARHDIVPVTVTDPREDELVDVGVMWAEDLETGELIPVDTASPRVREAYKRQALQQKLQRDTLFKRLGLDAVGVRTDRPYISPLVEFFRRRARRRHAG
jgi:uncharacterized protein (DUF58 family)